MSGEVKQNTSVASGVIATAPSATESASDPALTTNPEDVGAEWHNTTSGEIFICSDNTVSLNTWIGQKGGRVAPARGVFFGGGSDALGQTDVIQYITIATLGDAVSFGTLSVNMSYAGGCSNGSSDRGLAMGSASWAGIDNNTIEYITISTPGNSTDFGDAIQANADQYNAAATSNGTNDRGVAGGGYSTNASPSAQQNNMYYVTISTTGNGTDFGDLEYRTTAQTWTSNGTLDRGIAWYGSKAITPCDNAWKGISYFTISSPGNAVDFGDGTWIGSSGCAMSNLTNDRGVNAGLFSDCSSGGYSYGAVNNLEYITISSTGNATDFGDLSDVGHSYRGTSSGTSERGVFGGGLIGSSWTDRLDYITINSTGNSTDYGDLLSVRVPGAACSDAV